MEYDPEDPDVKFKDTKLPNFEDTNRTYLQYMEAVGGKLVDPLSPDGVRLQAKYLMELDDNQHPLDILRRISVNPFAAPKDRITASKAILEYTMAKVPSKLEVSGPAGSAIKIDQSQLSALSCSELDTLLELLDKAQQAKD